MPFQKWGSLACALLIPFSLFGCAKAGTAAASSGAGSRAPSSSVSQQSPSSAPPAVSSAGGSTAQTSKAGGKATSSAKTAVNATKYPLTVTDDVGRKFTIKSKPQRLACISATYLNTLYQIGGTAYVRSDTSAGGTIPDAAKSVFSVGNTVQINMELLISKQPDLVICQKGLHDTVAAQLIAAGIPTIELSMEGFDDVAHDVRLLGSIVDRQDAAEALIASMKQRVQAVVARAPKKTVKAVILYVTSTDVSVKLDNSIAGDVAKQLGIQNIASGLKPVASGSDYAPFSLETIVAANPDIILVSTMVAATSDAQKRISTDLGNNPAWNGLTAVKEGKIYFLPQSYFLYNPGLDYDVAVEYKAKLVYPEVFGSVDS